MLFMVFGLFQGFLPKNVLASNNYVSNISLYCGADAKLTLKFYVDTSFTMTAVNGYMSIHRQKPGEYEYRYGDFWQKGKVKADSPLTYTAGNWYENYLWYDIFWEDGPIHCPVDDFWTWDNTCYVDYLGLIPGQTCPTEHPLWVKPSPCFQDTQKYYYSEFPTLTITYPNNNAEIANIFNIQGSFTQPAENPASFLQADIMPTGIYISSLQSFWTAINQATSGNFSITIGNVPSGYYDFRIYFRSGAFDGYQGALISNIHIVNDLPPFLPPWAEQPPSTAPTVFEPIATSTFSTSTGLYTQLTGTFAPVILSIVSNLQQFSSKFTQTNASSTGNQIGQSVLLVRSYLSNINSFFSNFPVSQFLLLYLIALIVVIVLRLIKGLINLFKI